MYSLAVACPEFCILLEFLQIRDMCERNAESLLVEYEYLAAENGEQELAYFLPEAPVEVG